MIARVERQIGSALAWLEALQPRPFFRGSALSVADITAAIALTYIREKLPQLVPSGAYPSLEAHRMTCEMMSAFQAAPYSVAEAVRTGWRPESVN